MLVILLAAGAAIGWGAADYFGGDAAGRDLPVFTIVALSELIGTVLMLPVIAARGVPPPGASALVLAAVAGVAVTIELSLIYRALSSGDAFITAPVGALGAAMAASFGIIAGDPLGWTIAIGLACALLGSGISAWSAPVKRSRSAAVRKTAICLSAAASIATMLTCLHAASRLDPYWATCTVHASTALSAGLIALVTGRRSPRRKEQMQGRSGQRHPRLSLPGRRQLARVTTIALTGLGGDLAYAIASGHGTLSVVAAISSLYPITTIALGCLLQRTSATRIQFAGVTLALLGAAVLSSATH
jgi:drug/metabolite transporter (DMT)-like permease